MQEALTLFLDLQPGEKADLSAVARAALAFDAAIKEAAYVIDPSLEVAVEFDSGTEGSLKLNALITDARKKLTDPNVLKAAALVILGWFATDTRSALDQSYIQSLVAHEQAATGLSDEDAKKIAEKVAELMKGGIAHEQVKRIYRELETDPKVTGVGATTRRDHRPEAVVPRSRFRELSTMERFEVPTAISGPVRTREKTETVTLISPVLLSGSRRWKFSFHEGEFGAPVLDQDFLDRVLSGREPIPMAAGLTMDVVLQTKEEQTDGVWAIVSRSVLRVLKVTKAPAQQALQLSSSSPPQQQPNADEND